MGSTSIAHTDVLRTISEPICARMFILGFPSARLCEGKCLHALLVSCHVLLCCGCRALDRARAQFAVAEGDLVTLLNVWRAWQESGRSRQWWVPGLSGLACILCVTSPSLPALPSGVREKDAVKRARCDGSYCRLAVQHLT